MENAASIASMLLTTEAVIADKPEKGGTCNAWRNGRHGWHGRYDVIALNNMSF